MQGAAVICLAGVQQWSSMGELPVMSYGRLAVMLYVWEAGRDVVCMGGWSAVICLAIG